MCISICKSYNTAVVKLRELMSEIEAIGGGGGGGEEEEKERERERERERKAHLKSNIHIESKTVRVELCIFLTNAACKLV